MLKIQRSAPTIAEVLARLGGVIDPEVGIGIAELGLVYDVTVDDNEIIVTMTMTTPACPLGSYLEKSVETALADIAGPRLISIDLTFDPAWSPDMITPEGRQQLGWST